MNDRTLEYSGKTFTGLFFLWYFSYFEDCISVQLVYWTCYWVIFFLVLHTCFTSLISFYNNVICLARENKVADVVFWIFVRLLILSLTVSFWTSCPSLGWVGTHWRTGWTAGCKGLRWMRLHLAGGRSPAVFLRISSRASAVPCICQWSGGTNWMPH